MLGVRVWQDQASLWDNGWGGVNVTGEQIPDRVATPKVGSESKEGQRGGCPDIKGGVRNIGNMHERSREAQRTAGWSGTVELLWLTLPTLSFQPGVHGW